MSEEKEMPPETLSKSWVVVDGNDAEGGAAEPALNSGVESVSAVEKESNDSHMDSDTDSISIISESDGCSRNGKSDEEEVLEVTEAAMLVTMQQIVGRDANEIEMLTSDYLKEKWKVKQLSIALAVVISSVILGYYIEATSHSKSNYQFEISIDDNFNSFAPVRRFDPYKKYGIKDVEHKKEPVKTENAKVKPEKPAEARQYKNDKEEELKIKEIYLSEKEKFLIQKEHELVMREIEMRQAEEAQGKATNEVRYQDKQESYKNNMKKENQLKQEKETRRDDKTKKQGHPKEDKNARKDHHDKKARYKYDEDEEPQNDNLSGKWYMNLHQARNNLRNKMDYPFIKKMKNKALWYFRWMFARESNRSNYKRKFKFEI